MQFTTPPPLSFPFPQFISLSLFLLFFQFSLSLSQTLYALCNYSFCYITTLFPSPPVPSTPLHLFSPQIQLIIHPIKKKKQNKTKTLKKTYFLHSLTHSLTHFFEYPRSNFHSWSKYGRTEEGSGLSMLLVIISTDVLRW